MSGLPSGFQKFFGVIDRLATFISTCSLLMLIIMVTTEVVLRYAKMPMFGIEESELFPIMWLYASGAVVAAHDRTHISCGLGGVICKGPVKLAMIDCLRDVLTVVLAFVAVWIVYPHFTYINKVSKSTVCLHFPTVYAECSFMIALFVMVLYSIRDLATSVFKLKDAKKGAEK